MQLVVWEDGLGRISEPFVIDIMVNSWTAAKRRCDCSEPFLDRQALDVGPRYRHIADFPRARSPVAPTDDVHSPSEFPMSSKQMVAGLAVT